MAEINYEALFGIELGEEPEVAAPEDDEELEGAPETEEEPEVTDPDELTEEEGGEPEEEEQPQKTGKQSKEDNARFAAARRKAEQERDAAIAKARADAQAEMDALIAQLGLKDARTGQPITTKADYDRHTRAQVLAKAEEQRKRVGMTEDEWNEMIAALPEVTQARQQLQKLQQNAIRTALDAEIAEIGKMDPQIKTLQDLHELPEYGEIVQKVSSGMKLLDAYKLATYDSRMQTREAARQNAINNARSKNHLTRTTERGAGDERVPSDVKKEYRQLMPDMSDEEIRKHWNADRKNVKR